MSEEKRMILEVMNIELLKAKSFAKKEDKDGLGFFKQKEKTLIRSIELIKKNID